MKLFDTAVCCHTHHTEGTGVGNRYFNTPDCQIRLLRHVIGEHRSVVHFINMITGQYNDMLRPETANDIYILVDRIRRAFVPGVFVSSLLCRQQFNERTEVTTDHRPATLYMAD